MTLQQLKYFVETVRCGSMNKAAEQLFIAQPSLSSALREIESELGQTLLVRTPRGVSLTSDGAEFLAYARQVVEQMELLEQRFMDHKPARQRCAISTQHYAFVVNAFVDMVKASAATEYEYTLRETKTFEIVEDVRNMRSELGILYLSNFNRRVIEKLLRENQIVFHPLFDAKPHVFISASNPLAGKKSIKPEELLDFPRLSFEQGEFNSFYFSEEILSTDYVKKDIRVGDRATIFNLMIGLNGYTISTGIVSADLNGEDIISVPLEVDDLICVGWIAHKHVATSVMAASFLRALREVVSKYDVVLHPESTEEETQLTRRV